MIRHSRALDRALAGIMPRKVKATCPRCRCPLYATVTLYVEAEVGLEVFPHDGSSSPFLTGKIVETWTDLQNEIVSPIGRPAEDLADDRLELACRTAGCGFGCTLAELADKMCDTFTSRSIR